MTIRAIIYHNPGCGTSRNVLAALREAGADVEVVEYLKTPPDRKTLERLLGKMGKGVRDILRRRGTPFEELGLDDPKLGDDRIFAASPDRAADRGDRRQSRTMPTVGNNPRPARVNPATT